MKKILILTSLCIILLASAVNAEFWGCFVDGEEIDFCNPAIPDRTCDSDLCKICMSAYDEPTDCWLPGSLPRCNSLSDQSCNFGSGSLDVTPPNATINSPAEGEIYTHRAILIDIDIDEKATIEMYDNNEDRGRWVRICQDCRHYGRDKSFDDGFNNYTFRFTDGIGNQAEITRTFTLDSKDPSIRSTEPRSKFASSLFSVEFTEESPELLELEFGNPDSGFHSQEYDFSALGIQSFDQCFEDRGRHTCTMDVNVNPFDGQEIEYKFRLTDIAGNTDESRPITLIVDNSDPIINDLDYEKDENRVTFYVDITEPNFDKVVYIDHLDPRARMRSMCSRLDDGICQRRITFKDGPHQVQVIVYDEAGNEADQTVEFWTDSREPRVGSTEPRRGFASGLFEVEFTEANPTDIILHYGNHLVGERSHSADLEDDCVLNRNRWSCETNVVLDDYHAQEIFYYFEVVDIKGNSGESRERFLDVDTVFPIINDIVVDIDDSTVTFNISITEDNFDEVSYMDMSSSRPRSRRLCSRLDDGICEKTTRFREGHHDVSIQVWDEAGHQTATAVSFDIE